MIVVGAGPDAAGVAAVRWAAAEAAALGEELHVVPVTSVRAAGVGAQAVVDAAVEDARTFAEPTMHAAMRAGGLTVRADTVVTVAPPGEALVAASGDAALLVVGRRRSQVGRLLLGSTRKSCTDHSAAPVAVVPDTTAARWPAPRRLEASR